MSDEDAYMATSLKNLKLLGAGVLTTEIIGERIG
jgi:hypothetical protein